MDQDRLYVLLRKDLKPDYASVQAGHAVAEFLLHASDYGWRNGTLLYLGIENEEQLSLWGEKLTDLGIEWKGFREPDIGDEMTAIACVNDGKVFSNLPLYRRSHRSRRG
jgi:hypothetical protein